MSKGPRFLILLGIVAALCGSYLWFFGMQTFFVFQARKIERRVPAAKRIPVELPDSSIATGPGKKLSYFGYEFEIPWDGIDETKTKVIGGNKAVIALRSGNVLMIWSGPPHEFINGVASSGKMDRESMRVVFGDEALQSDYTFKRKLLEYTPEQITLFTPRRKAAALGVVLLIKAIAVPAGAQSGIYCVRTPYFPGFQYGNPQDRPKTTKVELFPEGGHLDLFFIQKVDGSGPFFSQGEINRVVQTIHRAAPEPRAVVADSKTRE